MPETELNPIRLTQFARGAGCGCKIAPQVLSEILKSGHPQKNDPKLLVGNESNDDAAVYDLGEGQALISSTDFFMPIVDDAYDFGRVAAANAISDIYAMGGRPVLALAVLGWPVDKLPASLAGKVIEGARAVCSEAGIPLAGGHSIDSPEPIFGLSVNGLLAHRHLKRNNTARQGDVLFLTKALGTGILSTAQKRGRLQKEDATALIASLTGLNKLGEQLGKVSGVSAMTDVTGFGLLGHLVEMAEGSGLSAELNYGAIPKLRGVENYLKENIVPDATYRNWNAYEKMVTIEEGVPMPEAFQLLPDPQTNGGLLFAVNPSVVDGVKRLLSSNGFDDHLVPIGRFTAFKEKRIRVMKAASPNPGA